MWMLDQLDELDQLRPIQNFRDVCSRLMDVFSNQIPRPTNLSCNWKSGGLDRGLDRGIIRGDNIDPLPQKVLLPWKKSSEFFHPLKYISSLIFYFQIKTSQYAIFNFVPHVWKSNISFVHSLQFKKRKNETWHLFELRSPLDQSNSNASFRFRISKPSFIPNPFTFSNSAQFQKTL